MLPFAEDNVYLGLVYHVVKRPKLQAIGPYLEDHTPITFASLLEREFGGFVTPPGYV